MLDGSVVSGGVDDDLDGGVDPGVGAGGADHDLLHRAVVILTVWAQGVSRQLVSILYMSNE